jgi:NAD(P)-dependent dehydrogenase (short-subunit alcohol dehydrogenase family)
MPASPYPQTSPILDPDGNSSGRDYSVRSKAPLLQPKDISFQLMGCAYPRIKAGTKGSEGTKKVEVAYRLTRVQQCRRSVGWTTLLPYTASKICCGGFSECLNAELSFKGIRVTTVCPGLCEAGSDLHGTFTGDTAREYRWFSLAAGLPGFPPRLVRHHAKSFGR